MKKIKRIGLSLAALAMLITPSITTVFAATENEQVSDQKVLTDSDLEAAVKTAKDTGVDISKKDTKEVQVDDDETKISDAKKKISDDYAKQIDAIKEATEKQKAADDKYNQDLKDWEDKYGSDSGVDGDSINPDNLIQELNLQSEPDAKIDFDLLDKDNATAAYKTNDELVALGLAKSKDSPGGVLVTAKSVDGAKGDVAKITWTDLKNSSYKGQKIVKQEVTFSDITKGLFLQDKFNSGKPSFVAIKDPAVFLQYYNIGSLDATYSFYLEDGSQIDFADTNSHAYLSLSSLNSHLNHSGNSWHTYEYAQPLENAKTFQVQGSSVVKHDKNKLYSDIDNTDDFIDPKWKGWDSFTSPVFGYGSGIAEFTGSNPKIRFGLGAENPENVKSGVNGYVWAATSTIVPASIVPAKPVKPAPEKAEYQLTNLVINKKEKAIPQTGSSKTVWDRTLDIINNFLSKGI